VGLALLFMSSNKQASVRKVCILISDFHGRDVNSVGFWTKIVRLMTSEICVSII
jgi:hypothetical protein